MLRLITSWVGVVLLIAALPASAAAQQRQRDLCENATGDAAIAACTRDIASGKFKGATLAERFINRGAAYKNKREYDRAIADYNEAIRLDPQNVFAFNDRGNAYGYKGEYDRAITDFNEAVRLDPKYARAFNNRGNAYGYKGDPERAIADYNEAVRLDPKDAAAFNNRGLAYISKGEYDRAIADYSEAVRLDPKNAAAFTNRGDAYDHKGEYDRAIADYNEAVRLDPKDAAAFNSRGNAYDDKSEYDRAIADYNEAIRLDPKYERAFFNRGEAYDDKGEYDRAIADYNEAIRLDPKHARAFFSRGVAYNDKGEYDRAIADFNEAIRLDPKYARTFFNRGRAYDNKREYDHAIADFNEAVRLDPKYARAFNNRGDAYNHKGEYDRAIADATEAIRLDPKDAFAFGTRGEAYNNKGEYDRAIADFNEAIRRDSKLDDAIEGLNKAKIALADQQRRTKPTLSASVPATPGRRVALVIGNANYTGLHALRNPINDATDMAAALKELGFEVSLGTDVNRIDMEEMMIRFAREARQASTALVYYSGHGLQHQGVNYLAPVDTQFKDESDLRRLIRLQDVIGDLQNASRVRILIIDACRDNEVLQQVASTYSAVKAMGFDRGFAPALAAKGTLLAFATQANRVAADGSGRNSPFTKALLKHLPEAGVELRTFLTRVRADVDRETNSEQLPEVSDSLVGEFILKAGP